MEEKLFSYNYSFFKEYENFKNILPLFDFFSLSDIKNKEFIKYLIENDKTNIYIKTIYNQYINNNNINNNNINNNHHHFNFYLEKIKNINNYEDFFDVFFELLSKKLINCFFSINYNYKYIINFEKLTLIHKEYYLLRDYKNLRNIYVKYIKSLSKYFNLNINALKILYLEIDIAKNIAKNITNNIANNNIANNNIANKNIANNNIIIKLFNFIKKFNINIEYYNFIKNIIINNISILNLLNSYIYNNFETIKQYLLFNYIDNNYIYISEENEEFKFNNLTKYILGTKQNLPKWLRSINYLENHFGDIIGYYFGSNYQKSFNININNNIINNIIIEIKNYINYLNISPEYKNRILQKLENLNFYIGYPNIKYNINLDIKNDFFLNHINLNLESFISDLKLYNNPKIHYWKILPHITNAIYHPNNNEIFIPISLFNLNQDILTFIISHEIVHSFDSNGIKYDYLGNYDEKYQLNDKLFTDLKAEINPKYLNEIYADVIALKITTNLYLQKNKDLNKFFNNYNDFFKFFITEEEIKKKKLIDIHPLHNYRIKYSLHYYKLI